MDNLPTFKTSSLKPIIYMERSGDRCDMRNLVNQDQENQTVGMIGLTGLLSNHICSHKRFWVMSPTRFLLLLVFLPNIFLLPLLM